MNITKLTSFSVFACLSLSACGKGDVDNLSQADATTALTSTSKAINSTSGAGALGVAGDTTSDCPSGGTLNKHLSVSTTDMSADIKYQVKFVDCVADGVTINGNMDLIMSAAETGATVAFEGELAYSGSVTGSCIADLKATANEDGASVTGTFCGHDGAVFSQVSFFR